LIRLFPSGLEVALSHQFTTWFKSLNYGGAWGILKKYDQLPKLASSVFTTGNARRSPVTTAIGPFLGWQGTSQYLYIRTWQYTQKGEEMMENVKQAGGRAKGNIKTSALSYLSSVLSTQLCLPQIHVENPTHTPSLMWWIWRWAFGW
jgi:hypothetical protein